MGNIIQTEGTGPKLFYKASSNAGDVVQLAKCLPSIHKAVGSIPSEAYEWVWWHVPISGDRSKVQGHHLKENTVTSIPKCRPPFSLSGGNGSLYLNVGTGLNKG